MRSADYLGMDLEDLLARLGALSDQLGEVAEELARCRSGELETRSAAWGASIETTVTGRDRASKVAAAPVSATLFELEGMRESLREERDFLRLLIDVRVRTREAVSA